ILCARGGFGSARILPFLNFDVISANPKVFVGFSDITVLLAAFHTKARLLTFHGPVATTMGSGSEKTRESFFDAITSNAVIRLTPSEPIVLQKGQAVGRVLGGNLINLCHLIGTPYEPDLDGAILFIEEQREAPYRIDRMLCHLRLSDRLSRLSGVALGAFSECGGAHVIHEIVKEHFEETNIPIIGGFEIGHINDNLTIPMGLTAELDTDNGELAFKETATL
ncbi:MAG: LD-carboxypeptidase, partial [Pseudomonadota bacterium]